ncbi:MAG: deoxyribodipyrimidine photo-lyase [Fimbriimonadaceae bacterium]|nr:deoxyribodipyrimidine photo-lyase [Fimbriimonadaceae bacterium]
MSRRRRGLVWIRRDLRLEDHTALAEATRSCDEVAVLFVFDPNILDALVDRDDRRVSFIHQSLQEVDRGLREAGSGLIVRHGEPIAVVPEVARTFGADDVWAARDFEPYAKARDAEVGRRLADEGCGFRQVLDHLIFGGDEIATEAGDPYRVFTPYSKAWRDRLTPERIEERIPDRARLAAREAHPASDPWSLEDLGFVPRVTWLEPGERAGGTRLERFANERMPHYHQDRDRVAREATSGLSAHLRFGTVSIRECARLALAQGGPGGAKWLDELIWREFYAMILDRFPHTAERAFRPEFDGIPWVHDESLWRAWCEGRTGYPLVDAAMRCLVESGWMPNRLRMVVASFLTKDLLTDYRRGEAYFARHLLDFDLASNNGGWQWAASTGVDAQPYFRVFNPVLQSRKFDPEGTFLRTWCPELAGFDDEAIHWPHKASPLEQEAAGCVLGRDYPHPIVDHATQRSAAIRLLESARS